MTQDLNASDKSVIIVGASVRAMASSARRAGYRVIAIDLFGDEDLRALADFVHVVPFDDYPMGIRTFLSAYPEVPLSYTGGIENAPELIEQLARHHPLWGNNASITSRVRDVFELFPRLRESGFSSPSLCRQPPLDAKDKAWLRKPHRSAGGIHVAVWDQRTVGDDEYLQEYISGTSYSSLFVARDDATVYLGSSRQLLLRDVASTTDRKERSFQYAGSIGPIHLRDEIVDHIQALGKLLTLQMGLRGLFGIDWIDHCGEVYLIEVNPRFTASSEVLEPTLPHPVFHYHAQAFDSASEAPLVSLPLNQRQLTGKLILFAPWQGVLSLDAPSDRFMDNEICFADVPQRNMIIPEGFPILTILTKGRDENSVKERLIGYGIEFTNRYFRRSD